MVIHAPAGWLRLMLLLLWLNYTSLKLPAQVSLFTSAVRRYPIHNWHHHSPDQFKDSMYKGRDKVRHSEPPTMRPNVDQWHPNLCCPLSVN